MTRNEFIEKVATAVVTYINDEEMYDDNAQLVIDPSDMDISIHDGDEDIDDKYDQYDIMDLIGMGNDGKWTVDNASISELAAEYFD